MRPKLERLLDYREYPILFVDDEPENLRVFELAFRREFNVATAASGEEALERLATNPAALVLSDHRMGGMSGVDLLAKVREFDPKTVRILVTAYGDYQTLTEAINNGWIYRYMAKPWRPEEMRLTLRNGIEAYALDREREELLHELEILNRSARQLNQELEMEPLLDLFLHTVTEELGYDGATVLLFDEGGDVLRPVRGAPLDSGVAERLGDITIPARSASEFVGRLCEGRAQTLKAADLLDLEGPVRQLATEIAAEEILVLPLLGARGVRGALMVDNRRGGAGFGASDHTLLDGLASQAVIAIQNAQLVDDLRRSREHVRRADRLGTLGTLAAGLAHEINNPLVSIRTFLSLAPEKRRENDPEFWGEYHELACKEVERIRGLVQTMGRLAHDGENAEPGAACDLGAVCREAAALLLPTAAATDVGIEVEVPEDLPKVFGVRDHLHQVILNLVLNAIHATPAAAAVHVAVSSDGPDRVAIEVRDTGAGIRSEDLERIFDPFFTTKGPDQGCGLGLMICHRIVTDHGGKIEVESLEGRGSTFRVCLPTSGG